MDVTDLTRRGLMYVLSSPSGTGKTTITRALLETNENMTISISATTRPRRPGEVQGQDYQFVDEAEFGRMVDNGEMLEHAKVFGHYYGTPRAPVEDALSKGQDIIFDIDWQGTQQLREIANDDLVTVFLLPPSRQELERRLRTRARDSDEEILNFCSPIKHRNLVYYFPMFFISSKNQMMLLIHSYPGYSQIQASVKIKTSTCKGKIITSCESYVQSFTKSEAMSIERNIKIESRKTRKAIQKVFENWMKNQRNLILSKKLC